MANEITNAVVQSDQEKFLSADLISRSMLRLVAASICENIKQPEGAGLTANFVRYQRMSVPMTPLTEATDPNNNSFSLQTVTVTLDQWGDVLTLSDVAQLTAKHPLMQQAMELLTDNAQRVIDREVQLVWMAGTNIIYGDSTATTRAGITSGMKVTDSLIHKARITLVNQGAPPRTGPEGGIILGEAGAGGDGAARNGAKTGVGSNGGNTILQGQSYVAVTDPNVTGDIMQAGTSLGTWVSTAMYNNAKQLYNGEVGTWLGIRWVETNFIPVFQLLGNTTAAVTSGNAFGTDTPVVTSSTTGGALAAGTYFYKVTKKDITRGFEEFVSTWHSTAIASGSTGSFTFNFSGLTAGYVYNLYFDKTGGGGTGTDANMGLVQANIAVGTTVTVTTVATGVSSPPAPATGVNVHIVYIHGKSSCNWVGLQDLKVMVTKGEATDSNPLALRRKVSYKFLGKSMIRDQLRMLRLEVASAY